MDQVGVGIISTFLELQRLREPIFPPNREWRLKAWWLST